MKRYSLVIFALAAVLAAAPSASAQMQVIPPGGSQFNPPPPAPPPPPSMAVPVVPQMDAPPPLPGVQPSRRGSFSDRITTCLEEGAAAGLGPSDRVAYSRSCANR